MGITAIMYIYIMGRAHSGSTILDVLLGNSERIHSVGELVSGIGSADYLCSCGKPLRSCPFWSEIGARSGDDGGMVWGAAARASVARAHVRNLVATWWARPGAAPDLDRLADATRRLAAIISAASGKPAMLDSAKEPTRALFLLKFLDETRLIHLVRDPRQVVASYYWRLESDRGFRFLRRRYRPTRLRPLFLMVAAASWLLGNLICELIARVDPGRVLLVRYEDLCTRPEAELRRIGAALGLPVDQLVDRIERGEGFPIGHNIGGNQIAKEGMVRFLPGRKPERTRLPRVIEMATVLLCWPLMRRYGYR
jgi:hypothetical protein